MANLYDEKILGTKQKIALAQKLRESGQDMLQGQMIGDRYVAPSWTQHLAQGLKQGLGIYGEMKGQEELKNLETQRLKEVIAAKQGLGIPATQQELEAAGTPAQSPSIWKRAGALFTGEAQPQGTPAVPMQQPPVANFETLTPAQQAMAMSNAAGIIPTEAAAYMAIKEHQATRDATKQKLIDEAALKRELQTEKLDVQRQIAADRLETERAIQAMIQANKPPEMPVAIMGPNGQPINVTREESFGKVPFNALTTVSPQQQQKMNVDAGEEANTASALFSKVKEIQKASHELKTSPGLPGISGYRGILPNLPESEASEAQNKYDSLMGKITSLGKDVAASSGAVGNMAVQEWGILRDTIAKIDPVKLGTKKTIEALDEVDASLNRLGSRTQQAYERTYQPVIEQDPKRFGLKFQPYQPQTTNVNDVQPPAPEVNQAPKPTVSGW
jgi:hypothetical protein